MPDEIANETQAEASVQQAVHAAFVEAEANVHAAKVDYAGVIAVWVAASVHNTPIAQSTEAYNHLVTTALPDLLKRLAAA
jgi:hypothetical protein